MTASGAGEIRTWECGTCGYDEDHPGPPPRPCPRCGETAWREQVHGE